jgi:hypothetical protein
MVSEAHVFNRIEAAINTGLDARHPGSYNHGKLATAGIVRKPKCLADAVRKLRARNGRPCRN